MATNVTMPKQGFDMEEGTIATWTKQVGDAIKKGDVIAEIETDKATVELPAEADGTLIEILVPSGKTVPVGTVLARIGAADEKPAGGGAPAQAPQAAQTAPAAEKPAQAQPAPTQPAAPAAAESGDRVKATPLARRVAQERGVALNQLKGSGRGGRIVIADVEKAQAQPAAAAAAPAAPAEPAPAKAPQVNPIGAAEEVPLTRMRKAIAQVMSASKGPIPHFYVTMAINMDAAMAERQRLNSAMESEGIKLSVNDLIVKAAALALRKYPNMNASFGGDKIVRHGDVNVGVAVALETGLITVVIRNADQKSLSQISQETRAKAGRAREGKLQPDDIGGGTFTVSNLGMYGVESFTAVITPPEAGILAVGGVQQEAVVRDGQIVVGQIMRATLSADHRVTDGAEGAQYMSELKRLLENPLRLML